MYCTIGGFTLDDTVLPTGEVRWSAPGGNVLYSAVGARLWGVPVGIVGPIGADYPQAYLERLSQAGFDLRGVRRIDKPSFHVWILHEGEGKRQIVYRLDSGSNDSLDPRPADIPPDYFSARGLHICPIRWDSQQALMTSLLARHSPTFLDLIVIPNQIEVDPRHLPAAWKKLCAFMPSIEEVRALWGERPLEELAERVCEAGPPTFAIKRGAQGSVVRDPRTGRLYQVPVYPTKVVDATGAGDAFCGGFMVGLQETGDPVEAALRGTVSASFVIEDFGALHVLDVPVEKAHERLKQLRYQVRPLHED